MRDHPHHDRPDKAERQGPPGGGGGGLQGKAVAAIPDQVPDAGGQVIERRDGEAEQHHLARQRAQDVDIEAIDIAPRPQRHGPAGQQDEARIERDPGGPGGDRAEHGDVPAPDLDVRRQRPRGRAGRGLSHESRGERVKRNWAGFRPGAGEGSTRGDAVPPHQGCIARLVRLS